jgi:NAD-dependent deacetylase
MTFSKKLIDRLRGASHVTVLTGAGISAESGIPTFRGKDGLWNNYKVEELATPQALEQNAKLFWQFYSWRRQILSSAKPNLGHYALVDLENRFKEYTLVTQNVDNMHILAGSQHVLELHGNIMHTRCLQCGKIYENGLQPEIIDEIPHCPACHGMLRPNVVLFGEWLSPKILREAQEQSASCEVFFSIGTSAVVEPAASLPYVAKANGAYIVEINPERTPLTDHADEVISGKSASILPLLVITLEKY